MVEPYHTTSSESHIISLMNYRMLDPIIPLSRIYSKTIDNKSIEVDCILCVVMFVGPYGPTSGKGWYANIFKISEDK